LWFCVALAFIGAGIDLRRRKHLNAERVGVREMAPSLAGHLVAAAVAASALGLFAIGSIDGINFIPGAQSSKWLPEFGRRDARIWVPKFWSMFRYGSFANLAGAEISNKASATPYTGGAHADHRNMRGSIASDSFLIDADLTSSDLSYAIFEAADARGASFENANLQGAYFGAANLTGANLLNANIAGASLGSAFGLVPDQIRSANCWPLATTPLTRDLKRLSNSPFGGVLGFSISEGEGSIEIYNWSGGRLDSAGKVFSGVDLRAMSCEGADLHGADFANSDLRLASFRNSDLTKANLEKAIVFQTNFRGTQISAAQVKSMRGWKLGLYDQALETELKGAAASQGFTGAVFDEMEIQDDELRGVNLRGASFLRALMKEAKFQGADFAEAKNLSSAQLFRADLRGARNLDVKTFQGPGARCAAELSYLDDNLIRALHLDPQHNLRVENGDLRGADATGCLLAGLDLGDADLSDADLTGANLAGTQSTGKFWGAKLRDANLLFADLKDAKGLNVLQIKSARHWQLAQLPMDRLAALFPKERNHNEHVKLRNFQHYTLAGTDWSTCDLQESDFSGADLRNAVFDSSNLSLAVFADANLADTSFREARIEWADFRRQAKGSSWVQQASRRKTALERPLADRRRS
jgi:uncharacterized protein YjbI with pentapeptide repeats